MAPVADRRAEKARRRRLLTNGEDLFAFRQIAVQRIEIQLPVKRDVEDNVQLDPALDPLNLVADDPNAMIGKDLLNLLDRAALVLDAQRSKAHV